jgi:hypothetical protein
MVMSVMHVRDMWVGVAHRLMFVQMRMRLTRRIDGTVCMTMVFIMQMRMRVGHRAMRGPDAKNSAEHLSDDVNSQHRRRQLMSERTIGLCRALSPDDRRSHQDRGQPFQRATDDQFASEPETCLGWEDSNSQKTIRRTAINCRRKDPQR